MTQLVNSIWRLAVYCLYHIQSRCRCIILLTFDLICYLKEARFYCVNMIEGCWFKCFFFIHVQSILAVGWSFIFWSKLYLEGKQSRSRYLIGVSHLPQITTFTLAFASTVIYCSPMWSMGIIWVNILILRIQSFFQMNCKMKAIDSSFHSFEAGIYSMNETLNYILEIF